MALIGTDTIKVPSAATLIFKHSSMDPLYIHSGATAIQWAYHLNTQSTPTIGGEVVQVLSALVGPMTIKGQTAGLKTNQSGQFDPKTEVRGWKDSGTRKAYGPNHELRAIMEWFIEYMHRAGTLTPRRDEQSIEFMYPERGWDFWIQVTKLDGFRYDKSVVAPEWSITAEIVNDSALNYFSGITMSSFTDDLITNQELIGKIGLSAFAGSKTETDNKAFGETGDHGSKNPFLNPDLSTSASEAARKMGDNFQALVAAWSGGNFATFGFGALLDNGALPKNVDAAYQQLFGTSFLALPGAGEAVAGGNAGGGSFTYNGNNTQDNYAVMIANAFSAADLPPELGVAVALNESSLDPNKIIMDTNGAYSVGLFMANLKGKGAGIPGAIAASQHPSDPVTKYWSATDQIAKAVSWYTAGRLVSGPNYTNDQLAQWAFNVERGDGYTTNDSTSGPCTQSFAADIAKAKSILAQFSTSTSSSVSASAQTARQFYKNPYRAVTGLSPSGIDQGVDFSGEGPVYALGKAKITTITHDWFTYSGNGLIYPGIGYTLLDGPAAGLGVYFAENITPMVNVGDIVDSSTVICLMHNAAPYTESGWASPGTASPLAPLMSEQGLNHSPKYYGVNFNELLIALGAQSAGSQTVGVDQPLPSNWPRWS